MLKKYKFLILISFMYPFDGKYAPTRQKHDFERKIYNFEALILVIHGPKWEYTQRSPDNKLVFISYQCPLELFL